MSFTENFCTAVEAKGIDASEKAQNVIREVEKYARRSMAAARVLNYFFADHGWEHSVRMSSYAKRMVENMTKEAKEQFDSREWHDMLVLLWTAIALHDIGMNVIENNECSGMNLGDVIINQSARYDHVRKSGERISRIINQIRAEQSDDQDIVEFINIWNAYWSDDEAVDTVTAMRIVKDIALMHGEDEHWLEPEKIGALERNVMSDIYEECQEVYKTIIEYDEALLCLTDLIDICPERMEIFFNNNLNDYFRNVTEEKRRKTFEHWVSHYISTVKFKDDGSISINMKGFSLSGNMYLNYQLYDMYSKLGAVEACLKWGKDDRLKRILEKNFNYKGITISLGRQEVRAWNNINSKAKEFGLYDSEQILEINSKVDGIENVFINNLLSDWIKQKWHVNDKTMGDYIKIRSVFHLLQKGADLHLIYNLHGDIDSSKSAYFVSLENNSSIRYDLNDLFLASVNAFYRIYNCKKQKHRTQSLQIISKGDIMFSSLLNGGRIDPDTAYIVITKNTFEDDLNKMIDTIKEKKDRSFLIFLCKEQGENPVDIQNCQKLSFVMDVSKYGAIKEPLKAYGQKQWGNDRSINETERKEIDALLCDGEAGIGEFLRRLKAIYNGIQAINEVCAYDLNHNMYSNFFILNLFEMMSRKENHEREVQLQELKHFYQTFSLQNRSVVYQMDEFETAVDSLRGLCEEHEGKLRLLEKYRDSFDDLIINFSREVKSDIKKTLFQMMIFFWLYNYRKVNYKSICYREYLTYLSPKQLCDYILNINIDLTERINISFETSEILADKLKENKDNQIKEFIKQYVTMLLKDKNALNSNEDIICFQSIYRIFRGILLPDMEEQTKFLIDLIITLGSAVGFVGFIEGVCSANLGENSELNQVINNYLNDILKKSFEADQNSIRFMTYDILYNYGKTDLKAEYFNESWENICASLHGKAQLKEENKNETYYAWKNMREKFLFVLNNTSPAIRKRNMFVDQEKESRSIG